MCLCFYVNLLRDLNENISKDEIPMNAKSGVLAQANHCIIIVREVFEFRNSKAFKWLPFLVYSIPALGVQTEQCS